MSKARQQTLTKGIFCISIDLELLWGRKDSQDYKYFKKLVRKEPGVIYKILKIFKKYGIHATWATVGKVLESDLKIVSSIKKVKGQDIGGHTFSHRIFTKISKSDAEEELKLQRAIFKKNGVEIRSFVFPKNNIRYLSILRKYGIKQYRGPDLHKRELFYPSAPPVFTPVKKNNCVNINGSMYFVSARGKRKYIPFGIRYLKSVLGINKAVKEKKIFHLWFHPVDLTINSDALLKELEMICSYAKTKFDKGILDLKNMQEIGLLTHPKN